MAKADKKTWLNPQQELFCQYFATNKDLYGNAAQTYLEVYGANKENPNWYKTACQAASRLLANVKVTVRISDLLDANWLNDVEVSKQHRFLIMQNNDLGVKQRAVDSHYRVTWKFNDKITLNKTIILESKDIEWKELDEIQKYIAEKLK